MNNVPDYAPSHPALDGMVAVITGGGGVLCSAMAKALGRQGVRVAVLNRTLAKAEKVAASIQEEGGTALALACNVLEVQDIEAAAKTILTTWGGIDILINGAGGNDPRASTKNETWTEAGSDFFTLDSEGFSDVFDLNFKGSFLPVKVFSPHMVGREGASILNISSMAAYQPMTKVPAYAAAKAAINNFTQWLAVHFAPAGIRVNALAPGFFATEQNRNLLFDAAGNPTARTAKILAHTPMARLGDPQDLLGALLWLCDPRASGFVTGTVVAVDGGFMAYSGV